MEYEKINYLIKFKKELQLINEKYLKYLKTYIFTESQYKDSLYELYEQLIVLNKVNKVNKDIGKDEDVKKLHNEIQKLISHYYFDNRKISEEPHVSSSKGFFIKEIIEEYEKRKLSENDQIYQMCKRIDKILDSKPGFFTRPNSVQLYKDSEPILTTGNLTTCFALFSILNSGISLESAQSYLRSNSLFADYVKDLETKTSVWKHSHIDWPYDVYTTPFKVIVYLKIIRRWRKNIEAHLFEKPILTTIEKIKENLEYNAIDGKKVARFSPNHDYSAFLSYWVLEALYLWDQTNKIVSQEIITKNLNKDEIDKNEILLKSREANSEIFYNIYDWAKDQLYRQVAYHHYGDKDRIDPVRSIYSLLIYIKIHHLVKNGNLDIKNKHRIRNYNESLVKTLIQLVLKDIRDYGLWKKFLPIVTISNNDGNVYPYALTSISLLLGIIDLNETDFKDFANIVEDLIAWIIKNEKIDYMPRSNKNLRMNQQFSGWRSPLATNPLSHPECWSTALTFDSTLRLQRTITKLLNKEIIDLLRNEPSELNKKYYIKDFKERLDSIFTKDYESEKDILSLKKTLFTYIIEPRIEEFDKDLSPFINSIILYGPPGTGKTSLTKQIASLFGWNYLRVDTSVFLKEGFDKITLSTTLAFDLFMNLEKTVILFDEIDEYIRDRQDERSSELNRMLTNIFLTKLNDLKENKNIIYFVATNHIEKIDAAISREGRFDFIIPINYPHYKIQLNRLSKKLFQKETIDEKLLERYLEMAIEKIEENPKYLYGKRSLSGDEINQIINRFEKVQRQIKNDNDQKPAGIIRKEIDDILKDIEKKKTETVSKNDEVKNRIPSLSMDEISKIKYEDSENQAFISKIDYLLQKCEFEYMSD